MGHNRREWYLAETLSLVWRYSNKRNGEKRAVASGMEQNELLPSFCFSASQWGESVTGQITRAQNHKLKQKSRINQGKKKSCQTELKSQSLWWFVWMMIEWLGHSLLLSAQGSRVVQITAPFYFTFFFISLSFHQLVKQFKTIYKKLKKHLVLWAKNHLLVLNERL